MNLSRKLIFLSLSMLRKGKPPLFQGYPPLKQVSNRNTRGRLLRISEMRYACLLKSLFCICIHMKNSCLGSIVANCKWKTSVLNTEHGDEGEQCKLWGISPHTCIISILPLQQPHPLVKHVASLLMIAIQVHYNYI